MAIFSGVIVKKAYISVGCHVGSNMVRLIDIAPEREELEAQKSIKNPGEGYKVFEMTANLASNIRDWFLAIGMDGADAIRHVVKIGHIFNEAENASREAKQKQALGSSDDATLPVLWEANQSG